MSDPAVQIPVTESTASQAVSGQAISGQAINGAAATAAPTHRTAKKTRSSKSKSPNGNGTAADSNSRTVAITLPKEILDWYDQQAAQAPYEPSTQRYIAWQLRQFATASQKQLEVNQQAAVATISEAQQ